MNRNTFFLILFNRSFYVYSAILDLFFKGRNEFHTGKVLGLHKCRTYNISGFGPKIYRARVGHGLEIFHQRVGLGKETIGFLLQFTGPDWVSSFQLFGQQWILGLK